MQGSRSKRTTVVGWILPLIAGALWAFQGVVRLALGCGIANCFGVQLPVSTPQAALSQLAGFAQEIGTFNLFIGILVAGTAFAGLRREQRWSWYVTLWFFVTALADFGEIGNPFYLLGIILAGLGLVLSYTRLFRKVGPAISVGR